MSVPRWLCGLDCYGGHNVISFLICASIPDAVTEERYEEMGGAPPPTAPRVPHAQEILKCTMLPE